MNGFLPLVLIYVIVIDDFVPYHMHLSLQFITRSSHSNLVLRYSRLSVQIWIHFAALYSQSIEVESHFGCWPLPAARTYAGQ
jgi:hypothetical protein